MNQGCGLLFSLLVAFTVVGSRQGNNGPQQGSTGSAATQHFNSANPTQYGDQGTNLSSHSQLAPSAIFDTASASIPSSTNAAPFYGQSASNSSSSSSVWCTGPTGVSRAFAGFGTPMSSSGHVCDTISASSSPYQQTPSPAGNVPSRPATSFNSGHSNTTAPGPILARLPPTGGNRGSHAKATFSTMPANPHFDASPAWVSAVPQPHSNSPHGNAGGVSTSSLSMHSQSSGYISSTPSHSSAL